MDNRDEQFKWFIVSLTTLLRDQEINLLAHQAVLAELDPNLDTLLPRIEAAKQNPTLQRMIQNKFDIPLAKFQETAEYLGIWKAVGAMLQEVHRAPKSN